MEISPELREFAQRYANAWSSQQPGSVASFFAESGSLRVNGADPAVGRPAITEVAQGFMTAFPDMVVTLEDLVRTPRGFEFHWRLVGTNDGPGGTGKGVDIKGYEEWTLGADGLVLNSDGHFDAAEYARQLETGLDR